MMSNPCIAWDKGAETIVPLRHFYSDISVTTGYNIVTSEGLKSFFVSNEYREKWLLNMPCKPQTCRAFLCMHHRDSCGV